jgi:hypothetical protein
MSNGQPPPTEYQWDTPLMTVIHDIFVMSDDLAGVDPRLLPIYGDRLMVNWQESGLPSPEQESAVYIRPYMRPTFPATFTMKEAPGTIVELPIDITIGDALLTFIQPSDDMINLTTPPRCIMMYGDRLQVNWQLSSAPEPQNMSVIDMYFVPRPSFPATITFTPRPPY